MHPHAKKSLYNTLEKLAKSGTQIFYITHSAEFLSYHKSHEIHRFYIDGEDGTNSAKGLSNPEIKDVIDDKSQNSINFNNAFFADIVFLVEGYTDYLFLEEVVKNKTNTSIEDLNISILSVEGKKLYKTTQGDFTNIEKFYNIYNRLNIKCFIIYDKDTAKNTPENQTINDKVQKLDNVYGFDEDLETFLDYKVQPDNNTGEKKSDAKIRQMKEWLKNPNQDKIDEIWNEITAKIPDLKSSNKEEVPF